MKLLLTAAVASAGLLFSGGSVGAKDPRLAAAIPSIEAAIEKSGADVAVALRTLDGRSSWFLRADEPFHAASTMKVPVLIELYHQAHQGKLRLEDTLVIRNQFSSLVDGSAYSLDASDDSEAGTAPWAARARWLSSVSS